MSKILLLFVVLFSLSISTSAQSQFESEPSWVENFDGNGFPDASVWAVSQYQNRQAAADYVNSIDNVKVKGGKLRLTVREAEAGYGRKYTAGRIVSKRNFTCGKIEFRAKFPVAKGVWNAVWLEDVDKNGDKCRGEIDIMEHIGCWGKTKYQFNPHLWGYFSGKGNNHKQYQHFINIDVSKYHVYTFEWYDDHFIVLVDGLKMCQINKDDLEVWPFDHQFRLVIALTYGGGFAGSCGLDDGQLPLVTAVDWIKYYELKKK